LHDFGTEVVTVRGELDLKTAPELRKALVAAIDATDDGVLVDLTDVSFLDSTALAAFVAARAHAKITGATLELVCPNPDIQRVFAITALNQVFRIHDRSPLGPARPRPREKATSPSVSHIVRLEATDEAPAAARRFVTDNLAEIDAELMSDLQLLVSEVVTNAVRYGGHALELRLWCSGRDVRVEVQDPGLNDLPDAPESVDVTAGHGRGLLIVDALASGWGVVEAPEGAGKVVWFELTA
jgi:anti-sigma B factor antagonist